MFSVNISLEKMPVFVTKFERHEHIKQKLLSLIDKAEFDKVQEADDNDIISKTDFYLKNNTDSEYYKFLKPLLIDHMTNLFEVVNPRGFSFEKMWFQQYKNKNKHGWHIHNNCHWTSVYFIEIPDSALLTEVRDWHNHQCINYSASEGDILTFPSFLYHRSPENFTDSQKTVISFNINFI